MDTAININDQRTADAFWTLLKPLKREVRQWLAMRLDESLKEQNNPIHTDSLSDAQEFINNPIHTDSLSDAQEFIKTLSVHGEKPVPSNEKGIYALLDEKY